MELQQRDLLAYIASLIYAVIFGLSFLFSKQALNVTTPFKLISYRFLLAFIVLSVLVLFKVIKVNYKRKGIMNLFILSLSQPVIYFIFESYGIKNSSTSYAGLMTALIPIIVSIMGIFLLGEIPNKIQWVFIILSVSGVIFIVLMDNNPESQNSFIGTLFLLIAVFVGSLYNILSRKSSIEFSSMEITYFMMGTGAIIFTIIAILIDLVNGNIGDFFQPLANMYFLISIFYLGILSSIIAFFAINFSLSVLPASRASIFGNLSTVISVVAGVTILKEDFHYYHLIGSIIIITGIVGTNYFNVKKAKNLRQRNRINAKET